MYKVYSYLFFLLLFMGLTACEKEAPPVPAYIYVPNIHFQTNSADQGTSSSNIKDAWISVDGQLLGVSNLPAILPFILDEDKETYEVRIGAGIENSGVANLRSIYPFYTRYTVNRKLQAGKIDTLFPQITYENEAKIIIVEDFEGPGVVFGNDLDGDSATYMIKTQEEQREGNYVGKIILPDMQCIVGTSLRFSNLQPQGTSYPVYLELEYKSNTQFEIGVIAYFDNEETSINYLSGVNPKDSWNKLYIDLSGEIYRNNAKHYGIVFRAFKNTSESANIYFDNIKLLHF